MSQLPSSVHAVVVGAGIHGLSAGWHLGLELARRGRGTGRDVVVLDKTGVGAGASGHRVRLRAEPLHDRAAPRHPASQRRRLDVRSRSPSASSRSGYVGVDEEQNLPAYERVWKSQNAAGYPSDLYAGEDARRFVRSLWPDFNTTRVGLALHERVSGYAGTRQAVAGLAQKCAQAGRPRPARGRGDGLRRRGRPGARGAHEPGADRLRRRRLGPRRVDAAPLADARPARDDHAAAIRTAASRRRTCGRTGGSWKGRSTTTSRT